MLDWFVPGRAARSEVDALAGATTVAIRELLTLLRRLTEQATRPVNRASELREMAAWFARCESDGDAHSLFDAAFGLSAVDHLGLTVPDVESDGPFASWWDVDPVDVPLSLRAYGRRSARSEPLRPCAWPTLPLGWCRSTCPEVGSALRSGPRSYGCWTRRWLREISDPSSPPRCGRPTPSCGSSRPTTTRGCSHLQVRSCCTAAGSRCLRHE